MLHGVDRGVLRRLSLFVSAGVVCFSCSAGSDCVMERCSETIESMQPKIQTIVV